MKVRPWALAKLNPDKVPLCVPTSTPPPNSQELPESSRRPVLVATPPAALLPLQLSGVGPWTVTWEYAASQHFYSLEHRKTEVFTEKASVLRADKVGFYRIASVLDGNGAAGKVPNPEPIWVDACPEARVDGFALKHGIELCTKNRFPLKVWLAGTGPFDLTLVKYSGKASKHLPFHGLKPAGEAIEGISRSGKFSLVTVDLADFDAVGEHLVRVESVVDQGRGGLERKYGDWDVGDAVLVRVWEPPSVAWQADPRHPPVLKEGLGAVELPIALSGRKPFSVVYERKDAAGKVERKQVDGIDRTGVYKLGASKPGSYRLVSVSDAMCEGKPLAPEEISVAVVNPPKLSVEMRSVKSSTCHGDIGAVFDLELSGDGPWKVEYKETQLNGNKPIGKVKTLSSTSHRMSHRWIPEAPGKFKVEFLSVSDANYAKVPLANPMAFELTILPTPDAKIAAPRPDASGQVYACLGSSLAVNVKLSGLGPWKVDAVLTRPDGEAENLSLDADVSPLSYAFPPFKTGGRYSVKLVSVSDSQGCAKTIDDESLTVHVLPSLPVAAFASDDLIKAREDKPAVLPLKLSGNKGPWTVELRRTGPDGKVHPVERHRIDNPANGISVRQEGLFEILSVRDLYCTGGVSSPSALQVSLIKAPQVKFTASELSSTTCRAAPSDLHPISLDIEHGSGTILVRFHEQFAHDLKSISSAKRIERHVTVQAVANGIARVQIGNNAHRLPGFYRFQLLSVSDDVYSNMDLQAKAGSYHVQTVLPDPAPKILEDTTLLHCMGDGKASVAPSSQVHLDFTGARGSVGGPWIVTYDLLADDAKAQEHSRLGLVQKIEKAPGQLALEHLKEPGKYHLAIRRIVDGRGCVWEAPKMPLDRAVVSGHALPIHVMASPSIKRVGAAVSHACVGDVAKFELAGGSGPFSITYSLVRPDSTESPRKTEQVKAGTFSVLLAEPGQLRIHAIANARCQVADAAALPDPLVVKGLPSASIDPGIQVVREGEAAAFKVHLRGAAPFDLTYQRLDETTKDVLESKTLTGLPGPDHVIEVDVGGTFRIESVKDKFCQYPRPAPANPVASTKKQ